MFLYFAEHSVKNSPIKIGVATDVDSRMKQLSTASPWGVRCFAFALFNKSETAYECERLLHKLFRGGRMNGEWFESINGVKAIKFIEDMYWDDISEISTPDKGSSYPHEFFSICSKNIGEWDRQREWNEATKDCESAVIPFVERY